MNATPQTVGTRRPDATFHGQILVDGSCYLYRAFHALPPLTNSRGEPTGAVHGVVNMLHKLRREFPHACVTVVFDAVGRTFRDELFAEYKATRTPMPDELRSQIEPLIQAVRGMGLPLLRISGVEADDVIGTLARRAVQRGDAVLISTGDKDMAQLVDEQVTLINTMTDTWLDRAGVKAKFDVWPEQIIDYLALVGDSSDNIPGIEKVGPKTAAKWLTNYGTLDELVRHIDEIPGKVGDNLRAGQDLLALSRKLATIDTEMELALSEIDLAPCAPDTSALRELYTRLEMRSLLRQLDGDAAAPGGVSSATATASDTTLGSAADAIPVSDAPGVERRYDTITEWHAFQAWIDQLSAAPWFAFGTETSSLEYRQAQIVGLAFCDVAGHAAYVPLMHDYPGAPPQLDRVQVLQALKPLLEDPQRIKVGQHLKYDMHVLHSYGIALTAARFDTMLESYVLNSTATRHDRDSMAMRYLGLRTTHFEDVAGKGSKQIGFNQVSVERATDYAAENVDITLRLHAALWPRITEQPPLQKIYEDMEQPLVHVLQRMESRGVLLDRDMLQRQSHELAARLRAIEDSAHQEAGRPFNLESPRQLQQMLYEQLQIPVLRKTPTGQPSTAEDVLEELAVAYAIPRLVLEYRALSKLRSTYTEKLPLQIDSLSGRVHTSYQQAVAATGRLSSSDPNLQNIPIRSAEGRRIRQAFVAPLGYRLLAADYSQIELRIMAHLSGDGGLLRAFSSDSDVHLATAAEVFSLSPADVSADQRRSAKAINFGLIYGMSAFGLARQLGIERSAAQRYVELYFSRYPGVKRYMDETRERARRDGFVETVFGRRLYLPDIRSRNRPAQQAAERAAINAPMQGTAADIIKRAMITVDEWCRRHGDRARLIMQVHDELVMEVPEETAAEVTAEIRSLMAAAAELRVPLKVDVGIGLNWDEAH